MHNLFRRAATVAAGVALAATATIGTQLPAQAVSGCKITFTSYGTVKVGTNSAQSKAAQCLLTDAGFRNTLSNKFSADDASKLKKFQAAHKLKATGTVDAHTWAALLSRGSRPTLKYGSHAPAVQRLQRSLTAAGYGHFQATGSFGPLTRSAVKALQKSHGWQQTGVATDGVWRYLQGGGATVKAVKAVKKPAAKSTSASTKGAKALAFAKKHLGDPYRYGAAGPHAWDCSGLTLGSWKAAGVKLPHSSQRQFRIGKKISKSQLRPGDLVFFYSGISHVAIYAGNGKVIHAAHPGAPVAYIQMKYMPYEGARRPA